MIPNHPCVTTLFDFFEINIFYLDIFEIIILILNHSFVITYQDPRLYFDVGKEVRDIVKSLNQVGSQSSNFILKVGRKNHYSLTSQKIICQRGRTADKSEATKQQTTTTLPISSKHRCTFFFTVYKEKDGDRWFVKKHSPACWTHTYHPPRERRFCYDNLNVLPEDTRETAEALLDSLVPASIVKLYVSTTSGLRLSDDSIQHLRKLVLDKKYNLERDSSTAQKLLTILDSTDGMSYVTYTGKYCYLYGYIIQSLSRYIHLTLFRKFHKKGLMTRPTRRCEFERKIKTV